MRQTGILLILAAGMVAPGCGIARFGSKAPSAAFESDSHAIAADAGDNAGSAPVRTEPPPPAGEPIANIQPRKVIYTAQMDIPDNFVVVDDYNRGAYEVRGVSTDGMVLAARSEDNAENGTLAFWAEAVKRELASRNYTLANSQDVESARGLAGKLMTFSVNRGGRPFTYMTAVFVNKALQENLWVNSDYSGGGHQGF